MPYVIRKQGQKYLIIRKSDNQIVGHSDSEDKAKASVRARMSAE